MVTVSLPAGVVYIGEEVFAYCTALQTINFGGTMAQWNAIEKVSGWKDEVTSFNVVCSDGVIESYMVY